VLLRPAEEGLTVFKVIVCGDREWTDRVPIYSFVTQLYLRNLDSLVLITGGARGADRIAHAAAKDLGLPDERNLVFPYIGGLGKRGGPARNRQMLAQGPDLVVAFHADLAHSSGTRSMVDIALAAGVPVNLSNGELWTPLDRDLFKSLVNG
jgi:hypothetical protein